MLLTGAGLPGWLGITKPPPHALMEGGRGKDVGSSGRPSRVNPKFVEEQPKVPFDFAQGRLSTAIGAQPPQRRRPVAGDPGQPPQRRRPVAGDPGQPPQRRRPVAGAPGRAPIAAQDESLFFDANFGLGTLASDPSPAGSCGAIRSLLGCCRILGALVNSLLYSCHVAGDLGHCRLGGIGCLPCI